MKLFDDKIDRTSQEAADYSEPHFSYANRSGRTMFAKSRETLEKWFTEYSKTDSAAAKDLRERFRSLDNKHHLGALTELYTYNLLRDNGFEPIPHPTISGSTEHPEFLAVKNGKGEFYVECTTVFTDPTHNRLTKFQSSILDTINSITSIDFLVCINFITSSSDTPPSLSKIKRNIEDKLKSLDYGQVVMNEKSKIYPKWEWQDNGWVLEFEVCSVPDEARKDRKAGDNIIGTISHGRFAKRLNLDSDISEAIKRKAKKYGSLDKPFLILVNVVRDSIFCDDYIIMEALFGKETVTWTMDTNGKTTTQQGRTMKGAFVRPFEAINKKISGIIVVTELLPWTIELIKPKVWLHPKAALPFNTAMLNLPYKIYNPANDKMEDFNPELKK